MRLKLAYLTYHTLTRYALDICTCLISSTKIFPFIFLINFIFFIIGIKLLFFKLKVWAESEKLIPKSIWIYLEHLARELLNCCLTKKIYYFSVLYVILSCLKLNKIIYINNYYSWVFNFVLNKIFMSK